MNLTRANEPQKAAIMHLRGPCLVLAGPGSGKTFVITNRILYLMEQGIAPESILVITFMKEAACSMQNRFRELAGEAFGKTVRTPYYPVNFGTFHSVFYHILKESNALKSNKLLHNSEKKNLILPILKTYEKQRNPAGTQEQKEGQGSLQEDAARILAAIGYYKNTMQMSAACAKVPEAWQPDFESICREYELAVRETGRLDFDDMLYVCRRLLEQNGAIRKYWQNRFRYILIDEFQDINPVQYEAVKLLTAPPYNIFAVGDDDQAIYGFRGSQPECLKRFQTDFQARQLLLDVNYRSLAGIVRASLQVIEENKDRFMKQLKAADSQKDQEKIRVQDQEPVHIVSFAEKEAQYAYMVQAIALRLQRGESCAVLFRTNSYMQGFAARLKAAEIAYEMKERAASIYEHFIVSDIMAYLLIAKREGTREHMLRIMNKPSRFISREAVQEGRAEIGGIRAYYEKAQISRTQKENMSRELTRLEKQFQNVRGFTLRPAIQYVLKAMGYEQYLRDYAGGDQEKWQEWQELLEWLKEDAGHFQDVREWKRFQEEYARTLEQNGVQAGEPAGKQKRQAAVHLLTVHGAKGLEFDNVWIPDCNEKNFPHGTMPDESAVEEERRIFYVAMTRAKKSLELLYLTGTKERPRQPSRFLNPLFT